MSSTDILNNVQKKLDNNKANDIVKNIETPPTTPIKMNVPDNPFMSGDGSDDIERDELTTKQHMMFQNYLKRNGYKDFGEWWYSEGREEVDEIYSEAIMNNEKITLDGNISKWWNNYLKNNLSQIIRQLKFIEIWGDTLGTH